MMNKNISNIPFNRMKSLLSIFKESKDLIIFDIGANIGQTVDEMLKTFPKSKIFSFEPQPDIYKKLNEKYKNYNNVTTFKLGLSNTKNNLSLYLNSANNSVSSSFNPLNLDSNSIKRNLHPKENFHKNNNQKIIPVEVDTLDNISENTNISNIDILKLDTQGHELEILEGAKKLLKNKKIKVVISECIFDDLYENTRKIAPGLFNTMYQNEFYLYDISHIYKDYERNQTLWADFIFIHSDYLS